MSLSFRISFFQNIAKAIFPILLVLLALPATVVAQDNVDVQLAREYFRQGEYEKASTLYKKLYNKDQNNSYYYRNFLQCLIAIEDFEGADKLITKQIKKNKNNPTFLVDKGYLLVQQDQIEEGEKEYMKAIGTIKSNPIMTRSLANTFSTLQENGFVIAAYEAGKKYSKDPETYTYDLGRAYKKEGNFEKMIENFLEYAKANPARLSTVKNEFHKVIGQEVYNELLQSELYSNIQNYPNETVFPELLTWVFIQNKDYDSAFVQVKALDKRLKEGGKRVFDLARTASTERQYEAAVQSFSYVLEYGKSNPFYSMSRVGLVKVKQRQLTEGYDFSDEDLASLESDYLALLSDLGRNSGTVNSIRDLSHLYAFYLHDLDQAITMLEEVIEMSGVQSSIKARSKLDLGDFYILKDDIWESTLFYSQVDKEFKEDFLGEMARFKNAKLSYFNGDFEWAQSQLGVLKASTSELIANDALELSIFIIDNLGLDTTMVTMQKFARADLFIFQNKFDEAFTLLDSLDEAYPGHSLTDDILYRRAEIELKRRDYVKAAENYQTIIDDFPTDILADNALFYIAELNERYFDNKDLAMDQYRRLMLEYPGSLYTVEARKRFRKLRGDSVN